MDTLHQRIAGSGGQSFVRDYQPQWANGLHAAGLRLRDKPIPIYLAIAEVPKPAKVLTASWMPHLLLALFKTLDYSLANSEKREVLFSSLLNRQELLLLDIGRLPRISDLFGRFDTFLQRNEQTAVPAVIEANFNNVEGLFIHHLSGVAGRQLLADLDMTGDISFPSVLWQFWQWLLWRYQQSRTAPPVPTIGILWEPGHQLKDVELTHAAECFRRWGHSQGIRVLAGDWRSVAYSSRHGWTVQGQPVHVIWKNVGPFYPLEIAGTAYERLPRADPEEICVLSDILGRLLGSKWLFEALWNPEYRPIFSKSEWRAIQLFVPWTTEVRDGAAVDEHGRMIPDLVAWLCEHKDELVLKPVLGSHAEGVLIGQETADDQWHWGLSAALSSGGWIVMRYIEPEVVELPVLNKRSEQVEWQRLFADCNFYVFGGHPGSVIRRASQGRILNIAQDAPDDTPRGGVLITA